MGATNGDPMPHDLHEMSAREAIGAMVPAAVSEPPTFTAAQGDGTRHLSPSEILETLR